MPYRLWNLDEILTERDIPGLIPNRNYPRYVRPEFGIGFHAGMAALRDRLREADRLYDDNLVEALLIYREMAESLKNMNTINGYRQWMRRIQDSLYDCWDQLHMVDEMQDETARLAEYEHLELRFEERQRASRHGG